VLTRSAGPPWRRSPSASRCASGPRGSAPRARSARWSSVRSARRAVPGRPGISPSSASSSRRSPSTSAGRPASRRSSAWCRSSTPTARSGRRRGCAPSSRASSGSRSRRAPTARGRSARLACGRPPSSKSGCLGTTTTRSWGAWARAGSRVSRLAWAVGCSSARRPRTAACARARLRPARTKTERCGPCRAASTCAPGSPARSCAKPGRDPPRGQFEVME
jgi:hypothetical protein